MAAFPPTLSLSSGIALQRDASRLLLCFARPKTPKQVAEAVRDFGLVPEDSQLPTDRRGRPELVNHTATRVWVRTVDGKPFRDARLAALRRIRDLRWIGPVYQMVDTPGPRGLGSVLPHALMIKPRLSRDQKDAEKLDALLAGARLKEDAAKSRYLGVHRYFELEPAALAKTDALVVRDALLKKAPDLIADVCYEYMPLIVQLAMVPTDTHFDRQWNMTRIGAGGPGSTGWDLSTGVPEVVICVLDWGCDRSHPDLNFVSGGINLGSMSGNGDGVPGPAHFHGTCCAGIAAARINNGTGVAGVAGGCRIMPVAFEFFTNAEVAAGINYAAMHGADVITMSFGFAAPESPFFNAVGDAINVHDCVLVASSGNYDWPVLEYPARDGRVIAVGGSDQADNRKSPASPDGECWGANYGNISVVAPAVQIPSTDRRGTSGINATGGGPRHSDCVDYAVTGDVAGDYTYLFNGTSAAAPHVAGLAALIRSRYPALSSWQVRSIIERTAEKVGVLPYADDPMFFPNGPRNIEMGYGRINVLRALDLGDVFIKDWPSDDGREPSTPPGGNFWDFSDIVVRPEDDDVFDPANVGEANRVERGRAHFLYIRVTNNGPQVARNPAVSVRMTPFVGLQFVYPGDWTTTDATHLAPTPLGALPSTLAAGSSVIAKFSITAEQTEVLWGWTSEHPWHPCIVASVTADNDYAFAGATVVSGLITRRNNLAQRNLSVFWISRPPMSPFPGMMGLFPFIAGSRFDTERSLVIVVDRSLLPRDAEVLLALDGDGRAFPRVDFCASEQTGSAAGCLPGESVVLLERTKFEVKCGDRCGVLTLEKGSRWDAHPSRRVENVVVRGGEVIVKPDGRYVSVREQIVVIRAEKQPKQIFPFALHVTFSPATEPGSQHCVRVSQRNEKDETVGGATAIFRAR
jgi:subtilisin family serine protease